MVGTPIVENKQLSDETVTEARFSVRRVFSIRASILIDCSLSRARLLNRS